MIVHQQRFTALTRRATIVASIMLAALPLAPVSAQEQSTGQIVGQPARDIGLSKTKVPPLLLKVSENPYSTAGAATCGQISSSIAELTRVIGPDFSLSPTVNKQNYAKIGGAALVNSLIPFRGIVREVSGEGSAERKKNAAIDAGIARRGFLRGLQASKKCR